MRCLFEGGNMKEFIEQLKQYKEFVFIIIAIVSGVFFVANYFATKEALSQTEKKLDKIQIERDCRLDNRVAVAEASATISELEREQIEKMRERIQLQQETTSKDPVSRQLAEERLQKLVTGINQLEHELDRQRNVKTIANDILIKNACTIRETASGQKERS
jgi:hypothetical protein